MDSFKRTGKPFSLTSSEKKLLIVIAVLIVIGIALIINTDLLNKSIDGIHRNSKESLKETDICLTSTCIHEASNLVESMDTSIKPCTDFYSFVCGNWVKNNYLTSSQESQFTKLDDIILLRIKEILEVPSKDNVLPRNKQQTFDFYNACMNKIHRYLLGAEELLSDLKKFGGWPLIDNNWNASSFDWASLMVQLSKNGYTSNMFFTVKVFVDVKNTSTSLLEVNQPSLGLGSRHYYSINEHEILLETYKVTIDMLANLLGHDVEKEQRMEDIEKALSVESKIAHMMQNVDMKYPETFYHIMSLEELLTFAPKIPWRMIFVNLLPPGIPITNGEKIMVTSPAYIEGLNSIFEDMDDADGKKNLANYMFYRVVLSAANFLSEEYYKLVNMLQYIIGEPPKLWEVCAKTTLEFFPLPLTASYVKRYGDNRTKEVLKTMLEDVKNSLADNINDANWLDEETKSYALFKVKKIQAEIGYQDEILNDENLDNYYKDVYITDNHFKNVKQMIAFRARQSMEGLHEKRTGFRWFEIDKLLTANAYYIRIENTITIPIGILQDTVYATERPNYINYGSLGSIVGHELSHALDSLGSLYDAEGNYRMWWSEDSWHVFEGKKGCYEEQYSQYYVPEAASYVNGELTLAENIADNGGLKAAYYAYNAQLTRIGSEKSLPGLQHYNEKQMFWIAYASVWCKKQTNESLLYNMKRNDHVLPKFRVIGTLSNMEEFSKDFNCKLSSTMNPASKCTLWK